MPTIAIDINDAGIVVADAKGILATEPGYAFSGGGEIVTGTPAYAKSRLHPRQCSNRFWDGLSLETGSGGIDAAGSSAELAYAQLKALWQRFGTGHDDAILLVPGHYDRDQLGVLLGLAQECEIPVRSMISRAVAAATTPFPDCQLVHVDTALHRIAVTPLEQGEEVAAQPEKSVESVGLASIMDLLARRVADVFVLATRFDPFHSAASEQLVYDRLPGWLAAVAQDSRSVTLHLPHDDDELTVEIARDQLVGAMTGFYRAVVQLIAQCREPGARLAVLLSDRLAAMPGLTGELERLDDARVVVLEPGSAALGAMHYASSLGADTGSVRLLKRLPWRVTADEAQSPAPEPRAAVSSPEAVGVPPSHVVYRGTAYAVDAQGVVIGRERIPDRRTIVLNGGQSGVSRAHCELVRRDGELRLVDLSRFGTFVNEKRISGEVALQAADVIRIGSPGEQLQVIQLEHAHGT
ncbi:MAG TPA: FHA domain-containing protein [Gammaproteobacteria bacterium]|nr:FHA domain-containing protein [Gammaproteobacteria bacterium]